MHPYSLSASAPTLAALHFCKVFHIARIYSSINSRIRELRRAWQRKRSDEETDSGCGTLEEQDSQCGVSRGRCHQLQGLRCRIMEDKSATIQQPAQQLLYRLPVTLMPTCSSLLQDNRWQRRTRRTLSDPRLSSGHRAPAWKYLVDFRPALMYSPSSLSIRSLSSPWRSHGSAEGTCVVPLLQQEYYCEREACDGQRTTVLPES